MSDQVSESHPSKRPQRPRARAADTPAPKESWIEQTSSFVGFFIYLLVLKTFFLPLFIIPTGSMAETLYGEHAANTCPNCGTEYAVGWQLRGAWPWSSPCLRCPNCRWMQFRPLGPTDGTPRPPLLASEKLPARLRPSAGDRIFVHGWLFDRPFAGLDGLGPARWDVVVFKVPTDGQTNYIKRLIGLPGEKIEIINGDIFVNDQIARKTRDAQRALWFPYYDHDHAPREPSARAAYYPRWVALDDARAWSGLTQPAARTLQYDGLQHARSEIQFATDPTDPQAPGQVKDIYAYNDPALLLHTVSDVRLSAEVQFAGGATTGYVELSTTKGTHRFIARVDAAGQVTVEHQSGRNGPRESWSTQQSANSSAPIHLALSHVDGLVRVEVDGQTVFESTPAQYQLTPQDARQVAANNSPPVLRIAAENTRAALRHVLIERDVYYTSEVHGGERVAVGLQDRPIQLGPDEYFVLGDNSPNSLDGRFAFSRADQEPVGPHLQAELERGVFHAGTVPADQLIGRAFFVYWPGFLPLTPNGLNVLPDLGRTRWIR
ncbi:MAG TPA: S26 family signal peptidase [Phycisphaerae bacterium]|nr:S26 family signal peptidase [Phycisphaerae bacterium]